MKQMMRFPVPGIDSLFFRNSRCLRLNLRSRLEEAPRLLEKVKVIRQKLSWSRTKCRSHRRPISFRRKSVPLDVAIGALLFVSLTKGPVSACGVYGSAVASPTTVLTSGDPTTPVVPGQLLNISTRMRVGTGDNVLIGGFIITGTAPKKVIIRALGPSLAQFGVPGLLEDPTLELHAGDGRVVFNDNWRDTQQDEIIASTIPPSNAAESAIVATLPPGGHTAIVRGKGGATGVALIEVYDLDRAAPSKLANISTRGFVETGDNVMIGGFIVGGSQAIDVVVRAVGPSLPVSGSLQDPTLEVVDGNGYRISNDDWRTTNESGIIATTVAPVNEKEAVVLTTLLPGAYTAIIRGKDGGTGVALVEAHVLNRFSKTYSLIVDAVTDATIPLGGVIFANNGELGIWQKVDKDGGGNTVADSGVIASDAKNQFWMDVTANPTTSRVQTILFSTKLKLGVLSYDGGSGTARIAVYVDDRETDEVTITWPAMGTGLRTSVKTPMQGGWFQTMHTALSWANDGVNILSAVKDVARPGLELGQALSTITRVGGVASLTSFILVRATEDTINEIPARSFGAGVGFATSAIAVATATTVGGPALLGLATLAVGNELLDLLNLFAASTTQIARDAEARRLLDEATRLFPQGKPYQEDADMGHGGMLPQ
jgi:hypothetical protein